MVQVNSLTKEWFTVLTIPIYLVLVAKALSIITNS